MIRSALLGRYGVIGQAAVQHVLEALDLAIEYAYLPQAHNLAKVYLLTKNSVTDSLARNGRIGRYGQLAAKAVKVE